MFWDTMIEESKSILSLYSEIRLSGDGRSDSPGHSAQYCTYVLMEQVTNLLVDLEVLDCRETEGVSTRMEKEGLMRLLRKLKGQFKLSEITTDASSSVIKALKELKKSHPEYAALIHSLDIWHKSKALRKALLKVAKNKEMEDLLQWVDAIVNHFWHCCENCGSDLTKLKVCLMFF